MIKYTSGIFLAALAAGFLFVNCSFAAGDDGFGPARRIEGRHFTVYCAFPLNPEELVLGLGVRPRFYHIRENLPG